MKRFIISLATMYASISVHEIGHCIAGLVLSVNITAINLFPALDNYATASVSFGSMSTVQYAIILTSGFIAQQLMFYVLVVTFWNTKYRNVFAVIPIFAVLGSLNDFSQLMKLFNT